MTEIHGKERLTGVTLAQVDEKGTPIEGTEEEISCDTLLLAVGLIPENELSREAGIQIDPKTKGPVVNFPLRQKVLLWISSCRQASRGFLPVGMCCMFMIWWIMCQRKQLLQESMRRNMCGQGRHFWKVTVTDGRRCDGWNVRN